MLFLPLRKSILSVKLGIKTGDLGLVIFFKFIYIYNIHFIFVLI